MRDLLTLLGVVLVASMMQACVANAYAADSPPADDPTAQYKLRWTADLPWDRVVSVMDMAGRTADERIVAAMDRLGEAGGVVYLPAGSYELHDHILLRDGIILRGEPGPADVPAKSNDFQRRTRLVFPRYQPRLEDDGTPVDTAFKGIRLANPATASHVGIVDLHLQHGHVHFGEGENHEAGGHRLVVGCILQHAAVATSAVPDIRMGQHPWQRFTNGHHAAIHVYSGDHALIANNRVPRDDSANFTQPGYLLQRRARPPKLETRPVVFDYDNRPGIYLNAYTIGGIGGRDPKGTPQTHPHGFRKGLVIRDNYIGSTGRTAICFTGDGTICSLNTIRFTADIKRYTHTGTSEPGGPSTNGNRAMTVRGWRWTIEGNDYTVHKNWASNSGYKFNDGEGIMHEGHANCIIKDSRLINNTGNAYLSLYKTAGVDGLLIRGNTLRTPGGISAIYVNADRNWDRHLCRNVRIIDNVTAGGGITLSGEPASGNLIRGNRHEGDEPASIHNRANAEVSDNVNYTIASDQQ